MPLKDRKDSVQSAYPWELHQYWTNLHLIYFKYQSSVPMQIGLDSDVKIWLNEILVVSMVSSLTYKEVMTGH